MSKITLNNLSNLQNETTAVATINANNSALTTAINSSLWRVGGVPNEMDVDLDMNSNRILNLPQAVFDQEPVRLEEFNRALFDATTVVLSYGLSNGLNFDTRAAAQATQIPAPITYITISKYATGFARFDAPYVRGGAVIPFFDGLGAQWGLDLSGKNVSPYWFGCKQDGVTDDTIAFQTAINSSVQCRITLQGMIGLSSYILVPANTNIQGVSNITSGFLALGSNSFSTGLLNITNTQNITINNCAFTGNLVEPVAFSTGAIYISCDINDVTEVTNITITNNFFQNFKTTHWIGIWQIADVHIVNNIHGINISYNEVFATAGCATTFVQSGNNGNTFIGSQGNTASVSPLQGSIYNVTVGFNRIVGLGLGGCCMCLGQNRDWTVIGNVTQNMGNNTLPADRSYTYLFYATTWGPYNISVVGNSGYGNHNNGVYFANANDSVISGNTFKFTYPGGVEPTLPWGAAIAVNGCTNVSVSGNALSDFLGGIACVGVSQQQGCTTISNNSIQNSSLVSSPQNPYGILLGGIGSSSQDCLTLISGNTVKVSSTNAIGLLIAGAGAGTSFLSNVKISNNLFEVSGSGIQTTNSVTASCMEVVNNRCCGTMAAYCIDINLTAGPVFLNNNIADFSQVVAGSSNGVRLSGPEVYIDGLSIYSKTNTGDALTTTGITVGTLRDVQFQKTTSNFITAGGMGYAIPTSSGKAGDFVQNLGTLTEQGSAGSKYILTGWQCLGGTSWVPQRMLTGN